MDDADVEIRKEIVEKDDLLVREQLFAAAAAATLSHSPSNRPDAKTNPVYSADCCRVLLLLLPMLLL